MREIVISEHDTRGRVARQITNKAGFNHQDARKTARILLALRQKLLAADGRGGNLL